MEDRVTIMEARRLENVSARVLRAGFEHVLALHQMAYDEYLKTEHWKFARLDALQRAAYRCQVCNAQRELQVHHRTYERRGCELASDLTTLCGACHALFHDHGRLAEAC